MNSHHYLQTPYNTPFIAQRADPYILHHKDGMYYFTAGDIEDIWAIRPYGRRKRIKTYLRDPAVFLKKG